MRKIIHQDLSNGGWHRFSFLEQMANVGTDVSRAIKWKERGNMAYSEAAFDRALELLDFTIEDPKNKIRLKEIRIIRELLIDYFMYDNIYGVNDQLWEDYFYGYCYAAALQRGK